MKTLTVEFNIYDSDKDEQDFDFNISSEGMNVHDGLSALSIILGHEMGRHSLIIANEYGLTKDRALNATRDAYEESFHKGYAMAMEDEKGDMKEEGPLDGSTGV